MNVHDVVIVLARERVGGRMTRSETDILHRRLDSRLRRIQEQYPADTDPGKQIARVIRQMSWQLGQRAKESSSQKI